MEAGFVACVPFVPLHVDAARELEDEVGRGGGRGGGRGQGAFDSFAGEERVLFQDEFLFWGLGKEEGWVGGS